MTLLRYHGQLWQERSFLLSSLYGVAMFTAGGAAMLAARAYLLRVSIHTVSSPDFFLDILPATGLENFLVWGMPVLLALMIAALLRHPDRIPFTLKALGFLFLVRAFFVVLTPLGIREDQVVTSAHGVFQGWAYNSNDFFFSGHTSFPFMFALIFWKEAWIRNVMLAATALFGASVLLAHTHYSIDVFAVPLIVPSVHRATVYLFGPARASVWAPKRVRRFAPSAPVPA